MPVFSIMLNDTENYTKGSITCVRCLVFQTIYNLHVKLINV